jgi:hypothetical protein
MKTLLATALKVIYGGDPVCCLYGGRLYLDRVGIVRYFHSETTTKDSVEVFETCAVNPKERDKQCRKTFGSLEVWLDGLRLDG